MNSIIEWLILGFKIFLFISISMAIENDEKDSMIKNRWR